MGKPIPFPDRSEEHAAAQRDTEAVLHALAIHEAADAARKEGYDEGYSDACGAEFWIGAISGVLGGGLTVAAVFWLRAWIAAL